MKKYYLIYLATILCILFLTLKSTQAQDNALNFDGVESSTGDYVNFSHLPVTGNTNRTTEAWIRTTDNNGAILSYGANSAGNRWTMMVRNGKLRLTVSGGIDNNYRESASNVNDGQWHHVAAVLQGNQVNNLSIYVDGVLDMGASNGTGQNINTVSGAPMAIGAIVVGGNPGIFLGGTIDEVRIWNTARTQAQISASMHQRASEIISQSNLVNYYPFDDGVANANNTGSTTAFDAGGAGNNGTITNFALNGTSSNFVEGLIYYTRQNGTWEDASIWSVESVGGNSCNCTPPDDLGDSRAVIGHNIERATDVSNFYEVDIESSGTLDLRNTNTHQVNTLNGSGTIRIRDSGLGQQFFNGSTPPVPNNNFLNTAGSTVEYYGNGNLPSNISTYQNLVMEGSNNKNLTTNTTVLGDLTLRDNTQFNLQNFSLTLHGNILADGGTNSRMVQNQGGASSTFGVTMDLTSNVTIQSTNEYTFNRLTINDNSVSGITLDIEKDITVHNNINIDNNSSGTFTLDLNEYAFFNTTGDYNSSSGDISFAPNVTVRTTASNVLGYKSYNFLESTTLFLDGTNQNFPTLALNLGNLRINNNGDKQINQHMTVNNLTFDGNDSRLVGDGAGFTLSVKGDWTDNGDGGFSNNGMAVEFTGTGNSNISQNSGTNQFQSLVINKSTGGSVTFLNDIQVNNQLRIDGGNLLINGQTLFVDHIDARAVSSASIDYSSSGQIVFENLNGSNDIHLLIQGASVEPTINGSGGKMTFSSTDGDDIDIRLGTDATNLGQLVFNNVSNNMFFQAENSATPITIEGVESTTVMDRHINLSTSSSRPMVFTSANPINIIGSASLGSQGSSNSYASTVKIDRDATFSGDSDFDTSVQLNIDADFDFRTYTFENAVSFSAGAALSFGESSQINFNGSSVVCTFDDVSFSNNTSVIFNGASTSYSFENFTFDVSGESSGINEIVFLASGQDVDINGNMILKGNTSFIDVRNNSGNEVNVNASTPQSWSRARVRDINASFGSTITVTSGMDDGNNTNVVFQAGDYYWVGNTGDWDNPNNWASTSGGTGGFGIPVEGDNVFFDNNSFSMSGQTVTVSDEAHAGTIDFSGVSSNVTFNFLGQVNVTGDLILNSNVTFTGLTPDPNNETFPGFIFGDATSTQNITSNGARIHFLAIANTETILQDDLIVDDILFAVGDMDLNGHDLKVEGDWMNLSSITFNTIFSGAGSVVFSGNTDSNIEVSEDFPNLVIDKNSATLSVKPINAGVIVNATNTELNFGILDLGTFNSSHNLGNITGTNGGRLRVSSNTSTLTFPTVTFADDNTNVEFFGSIDYTLPPSLDLPNVIITGSGTKTLSGSAPGNFVNDITIEAGSTFNGGSTTVLQVSGDWDNKGTFIPSNSNVLFNGSGLQSIDNDSGMENFSILQVNKPLFNLRPNTDISISSNLTLTNGHIVIPTTNVIIENGATLTGGSTSSYIVTSGTGTLIFEDLGSGTRLFPIGTVASYTPAQINLTASTSGNSTARVRPAGQNGLEDLPASVVNFVDLVWELDIPNNGSSSNNVTLNWQNSDETGTLTAQTKVHKFTSDWTEQSSSYTVGNTNILATSIDTYGQFAVYLPNTEVNLNTIGPAVASNITAGTTDNILYELEINLSNSNTDLTSVTLATSGSFTGTDLNNFRLILSEDNDLGTTGDNTQLGSSFASGGVMNFNGFSEALDVVSSPYTLFLIADATNTAISGRNVNVQAPNISNFTFSDANVNGTLSASATQTILGVPTISSINPTSVTSGGSDFTLTVNGTLFDATSTINWNGSSSGLTTTFVSDTELTTTIPASFIINSGTAVITVSEPVGGSSNAENLTIDNAVPVLSTISPTSASAGGNDFLMVVIGSNFTTSSTVRWNGADLVTTFLTSTQLLASVPAANIAAAGDFPVTVFNPTPGGGTSTSIDFVVSNALPTLTSISPASVTAGSSDFTLTVNGSGFNSNTVVRLDGSDLTTTLVNSSQLTVTVPAATIIDGGTIEVTTFNPIPGGGTSNILILTINNPVPTITSTSPTSITVGDSDFTLTVNGTNFTPSSVIRWNGTDLTTTFVNATQITATITSSLFQSSGTASITVFNPTPSGGESSASSFTINNPMPSITSLTPTDAEAGSSTFTLTINGTNFSGNSVVNFGATPLTTTFVNNGELSANVPASLIINAGTENITVDNPSPGGGTSSAEVFTINNPLPSLIAISPSTATAGGGDFTLTVVGSGFNINSVIRWDGSDLTTTFISSTQLTTTVPAANIASAGSVTVTIFNPTPGGGSSTGQTLNIVNPTLSVSVINPSQVVAGGADFTLSVFGTGFISGQSVVRWDGVDLVTNFVSASELSADVPASNIVNAGVVGITVFSDGNTSNQQLLVVNNPLPSLASFTPTSIVAGGSDFTITVNGGNFNGSSIIRWNSTDLTPTTFVNANQITATVPASLFTSSGSATITVNNPGPGGGTTSGQVITIENPVPNISSLSPSSATAGDTGFTLTITGTNFTSNSVVQWEGSNLSTSFVSDTELTATIPTVNLNVADTYDITVFTPTPGGGTSNVSTFTVNNPSPTLTSISPTSIASGSSNFTLTVTGTDFNSSSTIQWEGSNLTTTFISSTQLSATVSAGLIANAGTADVTVFNPAPSGGTSTAIEFTIENPAPSISFINPNQVTAEVGGSDVILAVFGSGFASGSVVRFNGVDIATSFIDANELSATIPAANLEVGGTANITVFNPTPGGGISNQELFVINNPLPTLSSINPTSIGAGGPDFTLTVTGSEFNTSTTIRWNGSDLTTSFVSATELTATVPASFIENAGSFAITVFNPNPSGGSSASLSIDVTNPVPNLTMINPENVDAGGSDFTLTVTGSNFNSDSEIQWAGTSLTTNFISSTQLTATVPAVNILTAGTADITIFNPTPGGGTSSAITLNINNPVPNLASMNPSSVTAGSSGFSITIIGNNFNSSSVVRWEGTDLTTTFISTTQLSAVVPSSNLVNAGTAVVTVFNPTPGGGESAGLTFNINNPFPSLTLIDPISVIAGGSDFILTVNGNNFTTGSEILWGSTSLTTSFVNSNELTATVPSSLFAEPGSENITVFNPTPGGGTSNQQVISINNPVPIVSDISPNTVVAGGSDFTLTVTGIDFNSTSIIQWNGTNLSTTLNSVTEIEANVPASFITNSGTADISTFNPTPLGGTSGNLILTINNPVATISSLSPSSRDAGTSGFTLTVNGTNIRPNSIILWEGNELTTTYINNTQVTAMIPSENIALPGIANVTIFNPTPGGGESIASAFTITIPLPNTPISIPASSVTPNGFQANWNAVDFADSYLLDVSEVSDFSTFVIQDQPVTLLNFLVTGLMEEQTYFYRLRAVNATGTSGYSNTISVTTTSDGLNAPSNLNLSALSATEIDIFWTDNSDTEITYEVERSPDGVIFSLIATLNPNSIFYADNGLEPNTTYYYRVRARGEMSDSPYSVIESLTTPAVIPNDPTNLDAITISTSQIDLSWNDNADNEDNYYIERSIGNLDNFVFLTTVSAGVDTGIMNYSDIGLTNGITYFYRVRAEKNMAFSRYSNISGATTADVPLAPSNLQITSTGVDNVSLLWQDNSSNETGFIVEVFTLINGFFIEVATVNTNEVTATINDLGPNRNHIFRVKAFNDNGDSPYTEEVSANTETDPSITKPDAPTFLEATSVTQNEISLRWQDNSTNEVTFKIERRTESASFVEVAEVLGGTTRYNDLGLSANVEYFYRVRASNEGGNSNYSNIDSTRADCNLLVLVESETGENTVCDGKDALLTANTNTIAATYRWLKNGLPIDGATLSTYLASEEGSYTCEIISGGCRKTADPDFVLIFQEGFDINVILSDNILESDFAGAEFYQWYYEFSPIVGANSDTYTPTQAGIYYVVATDNGCSATSNLVDFGDFTTSLEDVSITSAMKIAPNPSSGQFSLELEANNIMGEYEIFLTNSKGETHRISQGIKTKRLLSESLNITRFAQGIYILEFRYKGKIGRKRIMKY